MDRRVLIVMALVAVGLGAGYSLMPRRAASSESREAPNLEARSGTAASEAAPKASLQSPEAQPRLEDVSLAETTLEESPPASALPPPSSHPEFEAKYGAKTIEELRAAEELLSKFVAAATQARFKELEPKFEDLLAKGEYGARIFAPGEEAHVDHDVSQAPRTSWFFQGKRPNGADESRYLDFDPTQEPATAALVAESLWVHARIAASAAKN